MRINETNLGNGLFRLNVEKTCCCENVNNIPTSVMDDIARDVVSRMKRDGRLGNTSCGCINPYERHDWHKPCASMFDVNHRGSNLRDCGCTKPKAKMGIDAHIDRPERENYGGDPWLADKAYNDDMRKFRAAESAIKACDWDCAEPLKGMPKPVGQTRPRNVGVGRPMPKPTVCDRPIIADLLADMCEAMGYFVPRCW